MALLRGEYDHSKLEGTDADIETSLKEYGFAWIETETEFLFYYGIQGDENGYTRFDFSTIDKYQDVLQWAKKEYNWVEWDSIEMWSFKPLTEQESMPHLLFDLVQYYGWENIFGSTYWEGLTYEEVISGKVK